MMNKKMFLLSFLMSASLASGAQTVVQKVDFSEINGVMTGNCSDDRGKTGVTVFFFPHPAYAAVSVLGGGPSSREAGLADPERNLLGINALVFAGGSSYGLEAAQGVMECLESKGIGYDTGAALVPLVCQSDIYDLSYGSSAARPDRKMGRRACEDALSGNHPLSGNVGAGTGATVGKAMGMRQAQKGGIGYAAARISNLIMGVSVVVNPYGDIYYKGTKIAGTLDGGRKEFVDAAEVLFENSPSDLFTGNTTIAAVFTNGDFEAAGLKKIANMSAAGMARAISPAFTMADGDTIYALSVGEERVASDINVAGTLAALLLEEAIRDAVVSAAIPESEYLSNVR